METELKLLLDPSHASALARSGLLAGAGAAPVPRQLHSTYYDTPDLWLQRHGAALRVRQVEGEGWVQTLKGGNATAGGLHTRDEWETPLRVPAPDVAALLRLTQEDGHWHPLLAIPDLAARLQPLFVTDFQRTVWMVRLTHGDVVEVALDMGEVRAGEQTDAISELELELKEGRPEHLFAFALALQDDVPQCTFRIGHRSKAERGFSLLHPVAPTAVKAEPVMLDASAPTSAALQTILLNGLRQVDANLDGVIDGNDPESVHQMRVGLRRLHAALRLFRDLAPLPPAIVAQMAQWRHALGDARDAEVFATETLPRFLDHASAYAMAPAAGMPAIAAALSGLRDTAAALADRRRREVASLLRGPDFTRGMLQFGGWVIGMRWREAANAALLEAAAPSLPSRAPASNRRPARAVASATVAVDVPQSGLAKEQGQLTEREQAAEDERLGRLDAPPGPFADAALRRLERRLRKRAQGFSGLAPEAEHAARIAAKQLRYGGEFFASLARKGEVRRFVKRLSALQDDLGARNDTRAGLRLLDGIAGDPETAPAVAHAAAFVAGIMAESLTRGEKRLRRRWKAFRRLPALRLRE